MSLREAGERISFEEVAEVFVSLAATASGTRTLRDRRAPRGGIQRRTGETGRLPGFPRPRRAAPLLKAALLNAQSEEERRLLGQSLSRFEEADPVIADLPPAGGLRATDEDRPDIPLLDSCDLWQRSFAFDPDSGVQHVLTPVAAEIVAAGPRHLRAAVELCYPPGPLTAEEVRVAARRLEDPAEQDDAIAALALGFYPHRDLEAALADAGAGARRLGLAILHWRKRTDPWFIVHPPPVQQFLMARWPMETVRAFALGNLPRLARIRQPLATFLYYEPLAPLLASIRLSPDPAERARLEEFARIASRRPVSRRST